MRTGVQFRASLDQQFYELVVAAPRRAHQGRVAGDILRIHVEPEFEAIARGIQCGAWPRCA